MSPVEKGVFVRKFTAAVVAAGLLVALSGCANSPFAPAACAPAFASGGNAALVTADGGFGKDPNASFPTPLVSTGPQVQTTRRGDGALVKVGDAVSMQITVYQGKTGAKVVSTDYAGAGLLLLAVVGEPAFGSVVQCAPAGSRIAAVGTAGALLGQASIDQNKLALVASDTIVLIVDIMKSFLGKANGVDQLSPAGLPAIVLAPNGQPGFTFPNPTPPTDLRIAVLKQGNGAAVARGDSVVVNYTGVLWDTKKVFDSTWDRSAPAVLKAISLSDDKTGVVPGFAQALIGQKVGSQVMVVIPPKFGYPAGSAPAAIPAGSTMVFVFDVLGIG